MKGLIIMNKEVLNKVNMIISNQAEIINLLKNKDINKKDLTIIDIKTINNELINMTDTINVLNNSLITLNKLMKGSL